MISRTPPRAFVTIEECRLVPSGDDFNLEVFASVERSRRPIVGENLIVYVNRRQWGVHPTDEAGRVWWRLENLRANDCLSGKQVLVEVCYRDAESNLSKAQKVLSTDKPSTAVDPTKAPKSGPPVATTLEATASSGQLVGGKMRYHVTLVARDQFGKLIAAGKVLWNCGPTSGKVNLKTGYAIHIVELVEPEVGFAYTAHSPSANLALAQPLKLSGPPKPEKAKSRLKVRPEEAEIVSYANSYSLTLQTYAIDGQTGESANVEFESDTEVTLKDVVTGSIIASNVKFHTLATNTLGVLRLEVEVHGFAANITLRHGQTQEEVTKKLQGR